MQTQTKPRCPRCGNREPALHSSQPRFAITDPAHTKAAIGTSYVYTCECGLSFTDEDDLPPKSAQGKRK